MQSDMGGVRQYVRQGARFACCALPSSLSRRLALRIYMTTTIQRSASRGPVRKCVLNADQLCRLVTLLIRDVRATYHIVQYTLKQAAYSARSKAANALVTHWASPSLAKARYTSSTAPVWRW